MSLELYEDAKIQSFSIAVTPRSGLRLRDEEEWEDSGAGESHHLLSIDVAELAAAVSCLPLHQRLNLDTSLFSVSVSLTPKMNKRMEM